MKTLTKDEVNLGFIGLGNMGSRITRRLLSAGYHLSAYDRDRNKVVAMAGAVVAKSIGELSHSVDVILSCLTNDEAVKDVYYGDAGVLANARPGTLVFEMSTVLPQTSRLLHQRGADHGVHVLDVAISGSTPAAEQGTLILLVGGDEELFQAAQPMFRPIAARSFHLGAAGAGTTMKLVVNTLLGVGMQAIAEAIPLGEKAGVERTRLLEVLSQTAVIAPAHIGKLTKAARDDYSPQFPLSLMSKDFHLILDTAKSVGVEMPATASASHINSLELAESPDQDFSAVIRQMEKLAKIRAFA